MGWASNNDLKETFLAILEVTRFFIDTYFYYSFSDDLVLYPYIIANLYEWFGAIAVPSLIGTVTTAH